MVNGLRYVALCMPVATQNALRSLPHIHPFVHTFWVSREKCSQGATGVQTNALCFLSRGRPNKYIFSYVCIDASNFFLL